MIDMQTLKEVLAHLNSEKNDALISHQFTGLLAGISIALQSPDLAKRIDHDLRVQWADTHEVTELYGPAELARPLIRQFRSPEEAAL